jgi:hypothetical protein
MQMHTKLLFKPYLNLVGIWVAFGVFYGFGLALLAVGQDGVSAIFIYIGPCIGLVSALVHGAILRALIKMKHSLMSFAPVIVTFLFTLVFGLFVYVSTAKGFFTWEFLFSLIPTLVAAVAAQINFKKNLALTYS